jgi:pretoxin HINT domain-containing protein
VETESGLRAIETIVPGSRVRSFDTATGKPSWREVLKLERRVAPQLVAVSVAVGSTIQVSPEHYFWVTGSGWVRARDLAPGDKLVASTTAGLPALVSALSSLTTPADGVAVYNLVVEGFDDYFVGTNPVLVHSCHFLGFSSLSESELPR